MAGMTDPGIPTPGERRLAHPPSDRFRAAEEAAAAALAPVRPVSAGRGLAYAALVVLGGAVAVTILGGVLTLTGGLLVVAALIGWGTAWALRIGAGSTIPRGRRALIAASLALLAVAGGQVGLWLYAGSEGGVLPLLDYLGQTFGPLVPIEAAIAMAVAWVTAR
jgi:hypothetical protein